MVAELLKDPDAYDGRKGGDIFGVLIIIILSVTFDGKSPLNNRIFGQFFTK